MKGTEILVPSTDDAPHSVFVEPMGTEIAPTVQVSLAKRIIQPGSNKVVCLAAKTTVPMHEGDLASVSDLALRLSDGTNVVLTMRFFNDTQRAHSFVNAPRPRCSATSARYVYDPDRYHSHRPPDSSPRLWLVCTGITITLAAMLTVLAPGQLRKLSSNLALPPLPSAKGRANPPSLRLTPRSGTPFFPVPVLNRKAGVNTSSSYRSRTSAKRSWSPRSSESNANANRSFLVPPPPPTAYPLQLQHFSAFDMAPYMVSTSEKKKGVTVPRLGGGKPSPAAVSGIPPGRAPESRPSFEKPVEQIEKMQPTELPMETVQCDSPSTGARPSGNHAPTPGNNVLEQPTLERIVLPE